MQMKPAAVPEFTTRSADCLEIQVANAANKSSVQVHGSIDWRQVEEWDKKYVFHVRATKDEYQSAMVESAEGCYLTLANGRRIFDFANQLICVDMGHRHPRMWALELVRNRETREPFVELDRNSIHANTPQLPASQQVARICMEEGVSVGAFLPNSIRLATAFVATKADIDLGLRALDKGLAVLDAQCD